jgi:anti-sigma factor (TIGR02949 family)
MNEKTHGHEHSHDEDIGCLEAIEWLYAWLDGELDQASVDQLEKHLEHCKSCFTRREMERTLTERIKESRKEQPSSDFRERLGKLLDGL